MKHLRLLDSIEAVSFDVFDTVLARKVHSHLDVHRRVAKQLPVALVASRESYELSRRRAEDVVRRELCHRDEITYEQIMDEVQRRMGLSDENTARIAAMELTEEFRSVVSIRTTRDMIREVRLSGRKVLFISDMYLPESVIRSMLKHVGIAEDEDAVYVSGDRGVRKATGALFVHVLNDLGLRRDQLMHIGDYVWSDYIVPRWKVGIRAGLVREARNNIYERLWADGSACPACNTIAGAARAARVLRGRDRLPSDVDAALYVLGCHVLGPILVGFVGWVLRRAQEDGVRKLYFLSRDGEIILDVARVLARQIGIDIEFRYLHVSRTAAFPAVLGIGVNAGNLKWLREKTITLTPRILAERLKVDAEAFCDRLRQSGSTAADPDVPMSSKELDRIDGLLTTDPVLTAMLGKSGAVALENLSAYLEHQGMFDGSVIGLVDLGWHGGIQDVLSVCFRERLGTNGIGGYYFGVDLEGGVGNRKYGYLFTPRDPPSIDRFRHLFRIVMELLCSGSHGMVVGYRTEGKERIDPVLADVEHTGNWQRIEIIRKGVSAFLAQIELDDLAGGNHEHAKARSLDVLKKLFFQPTLAEAEGLGDLFFSADQAGYGKHRVADPFTVASIVRYLLKRSYAQRSTISSWFFGSWRRSGPVIRMMLYPVVLLLRAHYLGPEVIRFMRLRLHDALNGRIGMGAPRPGEKNG